MYREKKPPMREEDHLYWLTHQPKPLLMPDGRVLHPEPRGRADLTHLALGLWAGYLAILFIPGRADSEHSRLDEKSLVRAYSGMMGLFPLIP